jgi:L-alanine-DL-glutamate epimerase-like enolase superfamily enzyme
VYLIIKQHLEPLLRGEDLDDIETLWGRTYRFTRWYGRKGAAMSAIGALDTACWDLRGKAVGKPVWSLLGGERRTCPAYASALLWEEIDRLAEEAAGYIERGFRRVKMRLGRSEDYDTAAVRAVRQAIGSENDLIVDASMRYHLDLARRMGKFFQEHRVFWFEEPFEPEDLDAYVALRGTVEVPIAAGENEFGVQGFREMIRAGAVDIVQPDVSRSGGIGEVWRIGRMADAAGLGVATHTWSDAVAVIANAHVVAALPNGITVEVDQTGNPFIEELLLEPLHITDGQLHLSRASGLGIELNPVTVERLRLSDPLALPDGSYSDMIFGKDYLSSTDPYEEQS